MTIATNLHVPVAVAREADSFATGRHTIAVLLSIGAMILASRLRPGGIDGHGRVAGYALMAATEWSITALIWFGCRGQGIAFRELIGRAVPGWRRVLLDVGLALGFLAATNVALGGIRSLLHAAEPSRAVLDLLPHNGVELGAFLMLSLTAGFCEEIIYRGYLQRQFTAWTGYWWIGVLLQGLVFGISHSYQGPAMTIGICLYGCLFGWLAHWRRNLRPGMIAHFVQDSVAGILLARLVK